MDKKRNSILEIMFDKSIKQSSYVGIYAKLIVNLISIYGDDLKDKLLEKAETFYKENIEKVFEIENYDDVCSSNKNKAELLGNFLFIGELYINEIVERGFIEKYIKILIDCALDSSFEDIERYVECLLNLMIKVGKKLEQEQGSVFKSFIMDKLQIMYESKDKFKPRLRFLVLDVIDLWKNRWE